MRTLLLSAFAALFLVGCASTNATMLAGAPENPKPRPASAVQVYSDTSSIDCPYDKVAYLSTSGSVQGMDEKVMKSAKKKAGEVGANAIVIGRVKSQGPSFGDTYGNTEARYLAVLVEPSCQNGEG